MTFPGGTHDLWIRYWLAAGGIDPDKDIETIVVPPPQMVANMKVGTMDCFCVVRAVEPAAHPPEHRLHRDHHRRALEQASGKIARHARRLRRQISERREGAADGDDGSAAVVREDGEPRRESPRSAPSANGSTCPVEDVTDRMKGKFDYGIPGKVVENSPHIMRYWRDHASYPFQSHDLWFITEDIRWGKFEPDYRRQGADQEGQPRGPLARGRQGPGRSGRPRSRPRPRAARRPSSTARSSIPKIRRAYLKSLSDQARRSRLTDAAPRSRGGPRSDIWRTHDMNMPLVKTETARAVRRPPIGARCCRCSRRRTRSGDARRVRAAATIAERGRAADRRHRDRVAGLGAALPQSRARRCRRRRACSATPGS